MKNLKTINELETKYADSVRTGKPVSEAHVILKVTFPTSKAGKEFRKLYGGKPDNGHTNPDTRALGVKVAYEDMPDILKQLHDKYKANFVHVSFSK